MKFKSFTYTTKLTWADNRAGTLGSDSKPEFRVASPPEFKGEAGVWTPEDLYVASVEACTMTTFLAFAQREKLPLVSYESEAEGLLEFSDGTYRFTKIIVRPVIQVGDQEAVAAAGQIIHDAHVKCLIANSIETEVMVEPRIETA